MTKDTIELMAKYNKIADAKMNEIVKTLTRAEWDKDMGGYFKSIHSLCSHIYICDFNWLKRFEALRKFPVHADKFFDREMYPFDKTIFSEPGEYVASQSVLDDFIVQFAGSVSDTDLAATLTYKDSSGKAMSRNFGSSILHFLNHAVHHRGMVSVYLEMLGRPNDFNSLNAAL